MADKEQNRLAQAVAIVIWDGLIVLEFSATFVQVQLFTNNLKFYHFFQTFPRNKYKQASLVICRYEATFVEVEATVIINLKLQHFLETFPTWSFRWFIHDKFGLVRKHCFQEFWSDKTVIYEKLQLRNTLKELDI